jgi:hypothetical protein
MYSNMAVFSTAQVATVICCSVVREVLQPLSFIQNGFAGYGPPARACAGATGSVGSE